MKNKKDTVTSQNASFGTIFTRGKKGVVDKMFVYAFSIIIILFAGFLVSKFIFTFSDDIEKKQESDFYNKLDKDYKSIYTTYGAEKVLKYSLNTEVKFICFIPSIECVSDIDLSEDIPYFDKTSLQTLVESDENVVLYGEDDILNSHNIGLFFSHNGCYCVKPNQGSFELLMENVKNKVYIDYDY